MLLARMEAMTTLFVSHSSKDNAWATEVQDQLIIPAGSAQPTT
jgi:hypothetical protein